MKTAPKMLNREMVLKLRWKIWGIDFTSTGVAHVAHDFPAGRAPGRRFSGR
jgi:hypothetical protein